MKTITAFVLFLCLLHLPSCKREHQCQCVNPQGDTTIHILKDSPENAKTKCDQKQSGEDECTLYTPFKCYG